MVLYLTVVDEKWSIRRTKLQLNYELLLVERKLAIYGIRDNIAIKSYFTGCYPNFAFNMCMEIC